MKCWRVDSTRLVLHNPSRQKSTRVSDRKYLWVMGSVIKKLGNSINKEETWKGSLKVFLAFLAYRSPAGRIIGKKECSILFDYRR